MKHKAVLLTISFAMLTLSTTCCAQDQKADQPNIDTTIALVRTAMQADRDTVIGKSMGLNDKEAEAFWPIYRKYENERARLDDGRVMVIKQYAQKYPNLTDADGKEMAERMFDAESGIAALKKKYFKEFNKVLPALTVAKFFQLDHRVDLVMDMNVEANLPALAQQQGAQER